MSTAWCKKILIHFLLFFSIFFLSETYTSQLIGGLLTTSRLDPSKYRKSGPSSGLYAPELSLDFIFEPERFRADFDPSAGRPYLYLRTPELRRRYETVIRMTSGCAGLPGILEYLVEQHLRPGNESPKRFEAVLLAADFVAGNELAFFTRKERVHLRPTVKFKDYNNYYLNVPGSFWNMKTPKRRRTSTLWPESECLRAHASFHFFPVPLTFLCEVDCGKVNKKVFSASNFGRFFLVLKKIYAPEVKI